MSQVGSWSPISVESDSINILLALRMRFKKRSVIHNCKMIKMNLILLSRNIIQFVRAYFSKQNNAKFLQATKRQIPELNIFTLQSKEK